MAQRGKSHKELVQMWGWPMLEKSCRKTCGTFTFHWCLKSMQGDSALPAPEKKKIPIPQRDGNVHRALGTVGPAFPGWGGEQGKELPGVLPVPPISTGWQVAQGRAAAGLQEMGE